MAHNAVVFLPGGKTLHPDEVVVFGNLRMWAENGLICIEDARDNSFSTISVRDALKRINGLNEMVGNSLRKRRPENKFQEMLIGANQQMIEQMDAVCRKAREQGEPFDESARRDRRRRLPATVLVPATIVSDF